MKSKLWGGRFSKATHKLVEEFTKSIHFDHKLARYDCIGSLAHIDVLKKAGLLSAGEHKEIQKVLNRILHEIDLTAGGIAPDHRHLLHANPPLAR
jgi:argininosuccinate lyase